MNVTAKKHTVYQEILQRLFQCRYRFGDRILVKEIAEETGVSRHPIMTAMHRLQDHGFVRITAQVGCEVVTPTAEEVGDFYRMFAAIEGLIAEFAALRATPMEITRLRLFNDQIEALDPSHPSDAGQYQMLNVEFHTQLHAMARSSVVCSRQLANFELSDFFLSQVSGFQAHLDRVADEHAQVIAAIAARDPAAAREAARSHIDSVARTVARAMERAGAG